MSAEGPGRFERTSPLIGCAVGLMAVFSPMILRGLRVIYAGLGDPRLVNYTLEHSWRWLAGNPEHASFWNVPLYYPQPNVTAYTDVLVGVAPFYWIWRLPGLAPDTAFQLWMLFIWTANFFAVYYLLRRCLGTSPLGSSFGAYLFAFGSRQVSQMPHQQLVPLFWLLLGFFAIFVTFSAAEGSARARERPLWIAVFFAAVVLQGYSSYYPFFAFLLVSGLALIWALVFSDTRASLARLAKRHWIAISICAALAVLVLVPLAQHYLAAADDVGLRRYRLGRLPRVSSWFLMGPRNIVFGWLQSGGPFTVANPVPHSNGLGVITLALCALGCFRARGVPALRLLLLSSLTTVVLATNFWGFSLWSYVHAWVPGAAGLRAVGRLGLVLALPAAMGLAVAFDRLRLRAGPVIVGLLAVACFVEQSQRTDFIQKRELRDLIATAAAGVEPDCRAFLLVCVSPERCEYENDDAAWVELASGRPTVNGRYGHVPPNWPIGKYQSTGPEPNRALLRSALDDWARTNELDPDSICWVEYEGFRPTRVYHQAFGLPY